jgi:indole-3-glycerol phosphate synthase
MKDSHLCQFASKRLKSLDHIDKMCYPEEILLKNAPKFQRSAKLSPVLKRSLSENPHVLFEVKKASPTLGEITQVTAEELSDKFLDMGARAISVLVDPVNFGGHPDDLAHCVEACPQVPFLWKDFVLGEYQVRLAKYLGASAVLLMTQLLEDEVLKDLFQLCQSLEIEAFVETHTPEELEFALSLNPSMVGINARDFSTPGLPIDLSTASSLLREVQPNWPAETVLVAQSGISSLLDLKDVLAGMPEGLPDAVQIGSGVSGANGLPLDLLAALQLPTSS